MDFFSLSLLSFKNKSTFKEWLPMHKDSPTSISRTGDAMFWGKGNNVEVMANIVSILIITTHGSYQKSHLHIADNLLTSQPATLTLHLHYFLTFIWMGFLIFSFIVLSSHCKLVCHFGCAGACPQIKILIDWCSGFLRVKFMTKVWVSSSWFPVYVDSFWWKSSSWISVVLRN